MEKRFALLCAAALVQFAQAALKYTIDDYVTGGLAVWYDGKRNVAKDKPHDAAATVWADLSGNGNDGVFGIAPDAECNWQGDAFYLDGAKSFIQTRNALEAMASMTGEVFGEYDPQSSQNYPNLLSIANNWDCGLFINMSSQEFQWKLDNAGMGFGSGSRPKIKPWDKTGVSAVVDAAGARLYTGGEVKASVARSSQGGEFTASKWNIGINYNASQYRMKGKTYAVRIYNRALSAEEIAANNRLDTYRFVTGIPVTNAVVETSVEGVEGTEEVGVYAVDSEHVFTAPAVRTVDGNTYTLAACTVEEWDDGAQTWGSARTQPLNEGAAAVSVKENEKVRISYKWAGPPAFGDAKISGDGEKLLFAWTPAGSPATEVAVYGADGATPVGKEQGAFAEGEGQTLALSFDGTQELTAKIANAAGSGTIRLGAAYDGLLGVEMVRSASEKTMQSAIIRISRTLTGADDAALAVNFSIGAEGDTSEAGKDFIAPAETVVEIPAGEASAEVEIAPLFNAAKDSGTSFTFALEPGGYRNSGTAVKVEIANAAAPDPREYALAADDFSGYAGYGGGTAQPLAGQSADKTGFAQDSAWEGAAYNTELNLVANKIYALPDWMDCSASGYAVNCGWCYSHWYAASRETIAGTVPAWDGAEVYFRFSIHANAAMSSGNLLYAGLARESCKGRGESEISGTFLKNGVFAGFNGTSIVATAGGAATTLLEGCTTADDYMVAVAVTLGADGADRIRAFAAPAGDFPAPTAIEWKECANADAASAIGSLAHLAVIGKTGQTTANIGEFALGDTLAAIFPRKPGPELDTASIVAEADALRVSATFGKTGADVVETLGRTIATGVAAGDTVSAKLEFEGTAQVEVVAKNGNGTASIALGTWYNGVLEIAKLQDGNEGYLAPAKIRISRAGADTLPLAVNIACTDLTAVSGVDYLATTATEIPAGEDHVDVSFATVFNASRREDSAFKVAIAPGNYWTPQGEVELRIADSDTLSKVYAADGFGGYATDASINNAAPEKTGFSSGDAWVDPWPYEMRSGGENLGWPAFLADDGETGSVYRNGAGYADVAKRRFSDDAIPRTGVFYYRFTMRLDDAGDGADWWTSDAWHAGGGVGLSALANTGNNIGEAWYNGGSSPRLAIMGPMPDASATAPHSKTCIRLRVSWDTWVDVVAADDFEYGRDYLCCVEVSLHDSGAETFRAFAQKVEDCTVANTIKNPAWSESVSADIASIAQPLAYLTLAGASDGANKAKMHFDSFMMGATLEDVFPRKTDGLFIIIR